MQSNKQPWAITKTESQFKHNKLHGGGRYLWLGRFGRGIKIGLSKEFPELLPIVELTNLIKIPKNDTIRSLIPKLCKLFSFK
jgi:hypothetical protein